MEFVGKLILPKLTTAERDAITFPSGSIVFNTSTNELQFYDGSTWVSANGTGGGLTFADVWAANTLNNC